MKITRRQLGILAFASAVIKAAVGCERKYLLQKEQIPDVSEKYVFTGAIESAIYSNPNAGRIELIVKNSEFQDKPCLDIFMNIDADLSDFMPDTRFSARYHSKTDFDMNSLDFQIYEVSTMLAIKKENKKHITYGWSNKNIKDSVSLAYWGIDMARHLNPGEQAQCKFTWDSKLEPEELEQDKYTYMIRIEKTDIVYNNQAMPVKKVVASKPDKDNEINFYLGKLPGANILVPLRADTTVKVRPFKIGDINLMPVPLEVRITGILDQEQSHF